MPIRNAVCLATDKNMLIPALFVANAVRGNSKSVADQVDVIIFVDGSNITDVHRRWAQDHGIRLCEELDTAQLEDIPIIQGRLSPATLMKLLIAEHLDGSYDKILYLDSDITIHDDITRIFSLDTGAFPLGAVAHVRRSEHVNGDNRWNRRVMQLHFQALGMTKLFRYFNTGVLYIDVPKWNRAEVGTRALDFIRRNSEKCFWPDEDALNGILDGRFAELSPIWNMRRPASKQYTKAICDIIQPVAIHYAGSDKPWRRYRFGRRIFEYKEAYRLYRRFVRNSPWPGWLKEQWTIRDLRANIAYEMAIGARRLAGLQQARAGQLNARVDTFRKYCRETLFADVDQSIAEWESGRLRLRCRARL